MDDVRYQAAAPVRAPDTRRRRLAAPAALLTVALSVPESTGVPLLILLTIGVSQLLQRTATSLPDVTGGANGKLAPAPLSGACGANISASRTHHPSRRSRCSTPSSR